MRKVLGKRNSQNQVEGERHLEQLFTRLNSIEMTLSEFIQRKDSLAYMDTVYEFISVNFKEEPTFKAQLGKLYDSLGSSIETTDL